MLINNEFAIERYNGQSPLTLLNPPTNMDSTTTQQYNLFMSNIVTIYGSQNSNGSLPVFFKSANGTPNTSSTLTQLEVGQEYYFISKNSISFPYAIPSIGGPSVSSCETLEPCCPVVAFTSDNITLSGPPESIYAYPVARVSGLIPGNEYSYSFESVAANWPSKISPISGTFVAKSYSENIDSVFSFCPTSGDCNNYFTHTTDSNINKDYAQKNIFSNIKIKLYPAQNSDCPIMTDNILIKCNKCLPDGSYYRPKVTISGSPRLSLSNTCCSIPIPLTINVNGADPGETYTFMVENWPNTILANPSSGTVSFGDGVGKVSTMINMSGVPAGVVKFSLTDPVTNETFVDFSSITCNQSC
jgi:hypothetical protein